MNASSEATQSLWMAQAAPRSAPALDASLTCDVAVVGAGMAGLSAAYEARLAGQEVIVLDRGPIAGGMSARTTAHLASACDDFYHEYIRMRGEDEARVLHQSQQAAIERIGAIQTAERIPCNFTRLDGYLFLGEGDDADLLAQEREACARIGFPGVEWAGKDAPAFLQGRPALRFPYQARFHPMKYLLGLADALTRRGVRIYAHTPVTSVADEGEGVLVETASGHAVRARAAIVATNSPINDLIVIHTKQAPYRTYVIAARCPADAVVDALYWDTLDPYHYVRLQEASDGGDPWAIIGGEDHKTGEAGDFDERFARLEHWARAMIPELGPVDHRWSGQVMEPADAAPFVGRNPGDRNIYVVTGDSGQGMTTGAMAGMLLRDLVLGRESPWEQAYRPARASLRAAGEYMAENAVMARNMTEYLTPGESGGLEGVAPGEGAVVRVGGQKVAAYRDPGGELHAFSAACTHAGCIVHWNALELCWDCPCHGSQFGVDGEPLNGPALSPLAPWRALGLSHARSRSSRISRVVRTSPKL